MAGRRGGFARKRSVAWAVGPSGVDHVISADGKTKWSSSVLSIGAALERTIVRMRGGGLIHLNAATAVGDGFFVGLGIGLVTLQADTAGAASIPGPISDMDWDGWMWHKFCSIAAITATIADGVNASSAALHFDVDTKAMRKWNEDSMAVVGMLEVTELGTASMELQVRTRMLLKQG